MKFYGGIDLHANNQFLGLIDENSKRIFKKRLVNSPDLVLETLENFRDSLVGVVVESTFNWYWLVDLLKAHGYVVHLANPAAIQKYSGLKHTDDKHDAFWLAEMLRLGILPESFIYPKEHRPVRDLLRKRGHLVRLRTSMILSVQNIVSRNCGLRVGVNDVKRLREDRVTPLLGSNEDLAFACQVSKESIDFFTCKIRELENLVKKRLQAIDSYKYLTTLPGVGKILSMTIALETGPITRFGKVGHYVSYCRKVRSSWTSNGKVKGSGNKKNGNKYLAWAFSEAAELARRHDANSRAFYQRKLAKSNSMVAHSALAHKLARAAYYVMKDDVAFNPQKLFFGSTAGTVNQAKGLEKPSGLIGHPSHPLHNGCAGLYCP